MPAYVNRMPEMWCIVCIQRFLFIDVHVVENGAAFLYGKTFKQYGNELIFVLVYVESSSNWFVC